MKTKVNKKLIRAIAFILMICLASSMFTGCGFVPGASNNNLCKEENKKIYSLNSSDQKIEMTGILSIHTRFLYAQSGAYGNGFQPKDHGLTFFRDIAILIYKSIFGSSAYNINNDIFAKNDLGDGFNLNPVDLIKNVSTQIATVEKAEGNLGNVIDVIKAAAAAILMTVWSLGFISQVVNEKFTMETLLKTLMHLLCGIFIITEADGFISLFVEAGNSLIEELDNGVTVASQFPGVAASVESDMNNGILAICLGMNFLDMAVAAFGVFYIDYGPIIAILMMAFPLFTMIMCAYKIVSMLIMRMLELTVRIVFAPIPLAFGAQNGFSQETIRYFRSIMACAAQPALMAVGALCVGTIAEAIANIFGGDASSISGWIGAIAMGLAFTTLSAYLGETKRLAKEVI